MKITTTAFLALALTACGLAEPIEGDNEGSVHGDDESEPLDAIDVEQSEIARIDRGAGAVIFRVDLDGPSAGEVSMIETARPDKSGNLHVPVGDLSPLETFLSLTDDETAVPRALIEAERDASVIELAATRETTDRYDEPLVATSPISENGFPSATASQMCNEGTTSPSFLHQICSLTDYSRDFCHNGTWHSVTDSSGTYRTWKSRSYTLACRANGRVRHYYKSVFWYKVRDEYIPSGNIYRFTKTGGAAWRRKITHSRTASGFVRGSSHFL